MKFLYVWKTDRNSEKLSAEGVVSRLEQGVLKLSQEVSVAAEGPRRPLSNYLRELVFAANQENIIESGLEVRSGLFETAFHDAPIGMVLSDLTGRITRVNSATSLLLGHSEHELIGVTVGSLSPPGSREEEVRLGNDVIAGKCHSFQIEKEFIHKNGDLIPVLVGISILRDERNSPIECLAHITDLRKQKQREKESAHIKSMETLSRLAGSIAHDFNNVLTSIISNIELARDYEDEINDSLDGIEAGAHSAERLVRQLMALHRSSFVESVPLNVDACLEQMQKIFIGLIPSNSFLRLNVASDAWISINPSQFEQVFINLAINAGHAIEGTSGDIQVSTKRTVKDEKEVVLICVEDSGVGMKTEVADRVFEPFFTTRGQRGGTGLGLSSVYAIVKKTGGHIEVNSVEGIGTKITILWPILTEARELQSAELRPLVSLDTKRVFVIDDQPDIIRVVRRGLEATQCQVITANSFSSARRQLEKDCDYDIILTDVILTDGTGPMLVECAREQGFSGVVVYMSGFTGDTLNTASFNKNNEHFLAKPFSPRTLTNKLRLSLTDQERPA